MVAVDLQSSWSFMIQVAALSQVCISWSPVTVSDSCSEGPNQSDIKLDHVGSICRLKGKCRVETVGFNVAIAIINHPFLMVYTTHQWWLGGWFTTAIPTLPAILRVSWIFCSHQPILRAWNLPCWWVWILRKSGEYRWALKTWVQAVGRDIFFSNIDLSENWWKVLQSASKPWRTLPPWFLLLFIWRSATWGWFPYSQFTGDLPVRTGCILYYKHPYL